MHLLPDVCNGFAVATERWGWHAGHVEDHPPQAAVRFRPQLETQGIGQAQTCAIPGLHPVGRDRVAQPVPVMDLAVRPLVREAKVRPKINLDLSQPAHGDLPVREAFGRLPDQRTP